MITVERVADAGKVVIFAVRGQHVVDIVVYTLEGKARAVFVALGGVVENNVQNDLNPVGVQRAYQGFELGSLVVVLDSCRIAGIRRKIADRIVAPVIDELPAVNHALVCQFVELENRHQLNCVNAQFLEVRQFLHQAGKRAGVLHVRAFVHGKSAHVHFVNHHVLKRHVCVLEIAPIEHIFDHTRMVGAVLGRTHAPAALAGHSACIRVEQEFLLVEQQAACRVIRAVHAVGVFKLGDVEIEHDHRPRIADAELLGKRQHGIGLLLRAAEQTELAACRADRVNGEADAARHDDRAVGKEKARTHGKAFDDIRGVHGSRTAVQRSAAAWLDIYHFSLLLPCSKQQKSRG